MTMQDCKCDSVLPTREHHYYRAVADMIGKSMHIRHS